MTMIRQLLTPHLEEIDKDTDDKQPAELPTDRGQEYIQTALENTRKVASYSLEQLRQLVSGPESMEIAAEEVFKNQAIFQGISSIRSRLNTWQHSCTSGGNQSKVDNRTSQV